MSIKNKMASLAATFGLASAMFLAGAPAQAQETPNQGWFKVCSKQDNIDICNTMNSVISESGQPLTEIYLIEFSGSENQKIIRITVPSGRFIPEGILLQVDNKQPRNIPYNVCLPTTCVAQAALDDAMIAEMKAGGTLTVVSRNFQGAENPIQISLKGFTSTIDGEGISEQQMAEQMQRRIDEISARQKEIEDRMRAEQQKAREVN